MSPLVLIASIMLIMNHQQTVTGYELACGLQFISITPQQRCTLRNATQYDLDSFGVAGIPDGALLEILNPEFNRFDEGAFLVVQKARNLTFSKGLVKSVEFQSSTLVSLKVLNSWLVRFEVVEEDNFSLKTLSIRSDKYRIISPTIRYLKSLEELTFQKCSLEFIDFEPFTDMEKLRLLDLSWNRIHSVRIDPTMPLAALKLLDISYNKLTAMQDFPGAFPALKAITGKADDRADRAAALIASELSCSSSEPDTSQFTMQAIWSLRWTGVILLLSVCGVCGDDPVFRCRDYLRYLTLNTCIIENVDLDAASDLGELSFPREMDLEFRNARFRFLGVELFQLMGDTRQLTLRGGFTREIIFWSVSIEVLRVINTDLVMFDVLGEPNYSLKQLAIRSALFSRWSPSMMYLKALEVIDVAYCNFTYFDLDRVGGFKNLRVLDLSNNKLQALHSGPFLKLERLEELYLQGNQLEFMWRFPDVVPGVKYITVSDNRWSCNWVVMARNTFWLMKVTLMDSDYSCGAGWENSGGLCCKPSKVVLNVEDTAKLDPYVQGGVLDILIEENDNETQAVGAEMGNSAVYLDDPIAV